MRSASVLRAFGPGSNRHGLSGDDSPGRSPIKTATAGPAGIRRSHPQRHPRLMRQHHRRNGQPQRIEIGAQRLQQRQRGDAPPWRRGRPPLSAADRRGAMANRAAGCGCPTPTAAPDPVGADRRRGRRPRCAPPAWANRHRADPPPAVRCRKADAPRRAHGREPAEAQQFVGRQAGAGAPSAMRASVKARSASQLLT